MWHALLQNRGWRKRVESRGKRGGEAGVDQHRQENPEEGHRFAKGKSAPGVPETPLAHEEKAVGRIIGMKMGGGSL